MNRSKEEIEFSDWNIKPCTKCGKLASWERHNPEEEPLEGVVCEDCCNFFCQDCMAVETTPCLNLCYDCDEERKR
jgi:hypothetical protein